MKSHGPAVLAILFLGMVTVFSCTKRQAASVAAAVGELADEVCVEGDTIGVCIKKCEAAEKESEKR